MCPQDDSSSFDFHTQVNEKFNTSTIMSSLARIIKPKKMKEGINKHLSMSSLANTLSPATFRIVLMRVLLILITLGKVLFHSKCILVGWRRPYTSDEKQRLRTS